MKTFSSFLKTSSEVNTVIYNFSKLGINLKPSGEVRYTYETVEYIQEAINKDDPFNSGLPLNEALALCLACTEEDRNNHIDDSEIALVNAFFGTAITRACVTKMHSKYI